jgi:hypothetical protein
MLAQSTIELIATRQSKMGERFLKGPLTFDWINANIPDPTSRLIMVAQAFMDMKGESSVALIGQIWTSAGIRDKDTRHRVVKRLRELAGNYEVITRPGRTTLLQRKANPI